MKIHRKLSSLLALSALYACGLGNSDEKDTKNNDTEGRVVTSGSEEIVNDQVLAGEDISEQTSEAVSSTMNLDSSSGANLSLSLTFAQSDDDSQDEERTCEASDNQTTVKITQSRSMSKTFSKNGVTRTMDMDRSLDIERIWSKNGEAIACNKGGTHIDLDPKEFEGVTLNASFSREYSMAMSKTSDKGEVSKNRSGSAEGSRKVEWLSVSSSDGYVTTQKQITLDISNSFTRTDKNGEAKAVSFSLTTREDAPLLVEVKREEGSKEWVERKIVSGTTTSVNADGGKIILSYDNALFSYEEECEPVSGTISGEIFLPDSETASKTFVADLSEGTKTISFSDGTKEELELSGCEMSKPVRKNITKVAKGLQKKISKLARKQIVRQTQNQKEE